MAYYDATTGGMTCDTSTAWVSWNEEYDSTCTSTTSNAATGVWHVWVGDTSGAGDTTVTLVTWSQWATVADSAAVVRRVSAEEIAAEREQLRLAAEAKQREREQAVLKAKALLHSLLDEQQRQQLERERFFEFVSQTGRRMRMKHGYSRNIDVLGEDGKRVQTLCAHPGQYDLVPEDHMVAQFLTLRHNEAAFMQVANRS